MRSSTRPSLHSPPNQTQVGVTVPPRPRLNRFMLEVGFFDRLDERGQDDVRLIGANEVGATHSADPKPLIGTTSLSSCVGFHLYDKAAGVMGVGHALFISGSPLQDQLANLSSMFQDLLVQTARLGGKRYALKLYNLHSGDRSAQETVALAKTLFAHAATLADAGRLSALSLSPSREFVIDSRDGSSV